MNSKRIICICIAVLLFALAVIPVVVRAESTNLSLGKTYTLVYDSPIEHAYPSYAYKAESKLTDGKFASTTTYTDPAFVELYRGTAVTVTIDLGATCGVSSVEIRTMQSKEAGVYCARYLEVAVSEDGEGFATVGRLEDKKTVTESTRKMVTHKLELDNTYAARYVSVTFSCDVFVYIDEVSVFGSESASGAVVADVDAPREDRGYAGQIDGIGNIVLMYTGGNFTEETLLPYFAYVDTDGNVADTMFDSMLFLPSPGGFDFSKPAGWDKYIDAMFGASAQTNLTALNKLVGDLSDDLELGDDYRYPVFLAMPYLEVGGASFGGITPNNLDKRTTIISSYIDQMIEKFNESDFSNLELKGFYWFHELISYSTSDYEEDLMINFNEYVHGKGLKSIWIPYYCAPGFERAADLGFDAATLQSGYAFAKNGILAESVEDSAMQAKKFGLGMEFELDINVADAYERIYKYIHTGYATGCMDGGMMMLYQTVDHIYQCANATASSDQRKIYELFYLYNKGNFTSYAPIIEPDQIIVSDLNSRTSGTLAITDEDSLKNKLDLVDLVASEGLTYVLEGDGFYLFNTKDSAPGLYTLTFKVSDGYNLSEEATVKVFLADFDAPTAVSTLDADLVLYDRMVETNETATLSAGTVINQYDVEDGWAYIIATVDGKKVDGFAKYASPEQVDSLPPDDSPASSPIIWIVVGIAALAVVAVVVIILFAKKQKNKG